MPRRRRKIAARRMVENELKQFVGKPNSPLLLAEVTGSITQKFGIEVCVTAQLVQPVEHITIGYMVVPPNAEITGG